MKRNSFICLVVFDFILIYSWIQQAKGDCEAPTLSDESLVTVTPDQGVYSNWSYIILSCQDGYTEGGSHYSYCYPLTGWNPEPALFFCYAGCTAPDLPSNTIQYPDGSSYSATQDSYMHNDVIIYACAEGLDGSLVGPDQATCIDGVWEPSLLPYCTDYSTDSPKNETSTSSPTPSVSTSNAATSPEKSYSTEPKQTTITQDVTINTDPEDSSTQFTTEAEDVFSPSAVPTSLISMTTSVTETTPYLDHATEDVAITTPMMGLFTLDESDSTLTSSNRPSTGTESLTTELFTMSTTPRSELTTDSDNLDRTEIFTDHADLTTDPQFTSYTDSFDRTETVTDFTSANLVTEMLTETSAVTPNDGISTESITSSTKKTNTDVTELVSQPDTIQTTDELFSSYTLETTEMFDITQEPSSVTTSATVTEETETRTTFQMATEEDVMTTLFQQSLPPTTETDQEYITTVDYTVTDTTLLFGTETKTSSPFATTNEVESSTERTLTDRTDVSSSNSPVPTNEYPLATEMITFPHNTLGYQDASNDTPTSTDAGDVLTSIMSITTEDFPTTNLDTTNGTESIFSTDFTSDFTQNTITNKQTDFVHTSATLKTDTTSGATDLDGTTLPDAYTSIATGTMSTEGVVNTDSPVSDMSTDSATMSTSLVSATTEQATFDSIATYRSGTTNQMPTLTTGGETTAMKTTPLPENTSQSYLTTFQETTIPVKATTVKPTEPRKTEPERTTQYPTSGLTASTLPAERPTTTATTILPQETTTQSELTSRKTTPGKATTVKPTEPKKTEPAKTTQHQTSDPLTSVSDTSSFLMVYEILEVDGNEANFTDDLTDPQSDLYKELVAQVCAVAVVVYGDLEGYTGCKVYNFTSGSIIVWFYTEFSASAEVTETTLLNTTLIKLENGNGSLEANGTVFTIDKNTIAITEVNVLTTIAQTSKSVDVTTATPKEADDKWKIVAYSMIGAVGFLLIVVLFLVCCGDRITKSCRTNDKLVVSVNGNPVRMSDGVVAEEGISPWQTYKSHTFAFFPGAWASSEDGQNHPHEVEMEDRTTLEGEVHDVGDDFDDDYTDDEDTVFDDIRFPPPPPTMMTSANDNDDVALHLPPENVDEELGIDNVTYNVMSH